MFGLTNAAAIAGNIAFIDRGTCGFNVKQKMPRTRAQLASSLPTVRVLLV